MKELLGILVSPPALPLLCIALGWMVRKRWPRTSTTLGVGGFVLLWALSTPVVAGLLLRTLEATPPLELHGTPDAQAIVVLSAALDHGPEYGAPTSGRITLQRLRYGAALHRRTGLPILCSGGLGRADAPPLAVAMAETLESSFRVPTAFVEDQSRDTWENAWFSARMLQAQGIRRVLLVTSAFHIPRAQASFEAAGLEVIPAPTGLRGPAWGGIRSLVPDYRALRDSAWFWHEVLGRISHLWRSAPP